MVAPPTRAPARADGADRQRSERPPLDRVRAFPSPSDATRAVARLRSLLAPHVADGELADATLLLLCAKVLDETTGAELHFHARGLEGKASRGGDRLRRIVARTQRWLADVTGEADWPDVAVDDDTAVACLASLGSRSFLLTAADLEGGPDALRAAVAAACPDGLPDGSAFARPPAATALIDVLAFTTRSPRTRAIATAGAKALGRLGALKQRNLAWMRGNAKKGVAELNNLPKLLHVELSTHCNLRCRFCSIIREDRDRPLGYIELETLERLRPELAYISDCKLHGGGEPFMHPRIDEVLQVFLDEGVRLNTVTNATLIRPRLAELIGRTFSSLTVSVDGATRETYEHLRVRASWDRLLRGIDLINAHRAPDLRLIIGVVMLRDNIDELPDLVRFAHEHGAQELQAAWLVPFESLPWTHDQGLTDDPVRTNARMDEARAVGEELGVSVRMPDNLPVEGAPTGIPRSTATERGADRAGAAPSTIQAVDHAASYLDLHGTDRVEGHCRLMYDRAMVRFAGDIKPCGQSMYVDGLGSVHEQSFEQCWNSPAYQALRSTFNGGTLPPTCRSCNFIRSKQLGSARLVY